MVGVGVKLVNIYICVGFFQHYCYMPLLMCGGNTDVMCFLIYLRHSFLLQFESYWMNWAQYVHTKVVIETLLLSRVM